MNKHIRNGLIAIFLAVALPAHAETEMGAQNDAATSAAPASSTQQVWESTKEGTHKAIDWTVEKSKQGWDKTKTVAGNAADWTVDKTSRAWEASKEATSNAAEWVKEKTESATASEPAPVEDHSL